MESSEPMFKPPTAETIKAALGKFNQKEADDGEYLKKLMKLFDPIRKPGPSDWLAENAERGQTFKQFARKIDKKRRESTIYLQPLEKEISLEMINTFEKFLSAYFPEMIIKVNPYIELEKEKSVASRINQYSLKKQYNASDILQLMRTRVTKDLKDLYCIIGCTMTDLYHEDPENFVFGLANITGEGVFSFARYDENFYLDQPEADPDSKLIIYRSTKVMAHEIGHMFGIEHCIFFECFMNGSNHIEEDDRKPMEFCPICIRKLQTIIGFDLAKRYKGLISCFEELGGLFKKDILWYENAIKLSC